MEANDVLERRERILFAAAIFDPAPLKEIATELGHTIRSRPDHRFDAVGQRITAVDGTVIDTVTRVA
jgi:hypothetical protein